MKSSAFLSKPAVVQGEGRRRLLWGGKVAMDSLVGRPTYWCPRPDCFSETTTAEWTFPSTFVVVKTSEQKK